MGVCGVIKGALEMVQLQVRVKSEYIRKKERSNDICYEVHIAACISNVSFEHLVKKTASILLNSIMVDLC